MTACPRCGAGFEDDDLRYCGRCGATVAPRPTGQLAVKPSTATELADAPPLGGEGLVGAVIDGRYRVLALIGNGGMGAVYRVEHTGMGKIAALKMIHPLLSSDREVVKRFRREAQAISLLAHPNTVQVFDFGHALGSLYMVMELVRGETLEHVVDRDGPLPWRRAAPLLTQICDAVADAHEAGIIHRDLKPENVLVSRGRDGREVAKVLDFGLAKLREREDLSEITARGSLIGTPFFMSPEQIRGEDLDPRSDIYSFGALMYRVLSGRYPFTGATPLQVLTQHLTQDPVPPSEHVAAPGRDHELDRRIDAMVLKCMEKAREDRFSSLVEVERAIRAAGETAPASRPRAGVADERRLPSERTGVSEALSRQDFDQFERSLRLRRRLGVALVPLLFALIGVAGWVLFGRGREERPVEAEVEPNNRAAEAKLIASGLAVSGTIGKRLTLDDSDRDFYRLRVTSGRSRLRLEVTAVPGMDLRLAVYDGAGQAVADADVAGDDEGELLPNQRLEPGEYYVEVREARTPGRRPTENVTDHYRLTATWQGLGDDEESEPDDTAAGAIPLQIGQALHGYSSRADDVDWYYPSGASRGRVGGELSAIPGVDLRLLLLPAGVTVSADPAKTPGARLVDEHGVGEAERFSGLAWPEGSAAPLLLVSRKPPPRLADPHRPPPGIDVPYTITLLESASPRP